MVKDKIRRGWSSVRTYISAWIEMVKDKIRRGWSRVRTYISAWIEILNP